MRGPAGRQHLCLCSLHPAHAVVPCRAAKHLPGFSAAFPSCCLKPSWTRGLPWQGRRRVQTAKSRMDAASVMKGAVQSRIAGRSQQEQTRASSTRGPQEQAWVVSRVEQSRLDQCRKVGQMVNFKLNSLTGGCQGNAARRQEPAAERVAPLVARWPVAITSCSACTWTAAPCPVSACRTWRTGPSGSCSQGAGQRGRQARPWRTSNSSHTERRGGGRLRRAEQLGDNLCRHPCPLPHLQPWQYL